MELEKLKIIRKEDTYVHCPLCGNYRYSDSYAHGKSEAHKQELKLMLQKVSMHLLQKKEKPFVIYDKQWEDKDSHLFCHFCGISYSEHCSDGEFIIESLGFLHHHVDSHHFDAVNAFMDRNICSESPQKFCLLKQDLDKYLQKIPKAKDIYLKRMGILDQAITYQIRSAFEERKKIVNDELKLNKEKLLTEREIQVTPWLEDGCFWQPTSGASGSQQTLPVIGPTLHTLVNYVEKKKRKGLPVKHVVADFKHHIRGSSRLLPVFQGVSNQGRRKQSKIQFNRRNEKI